MASNVWEEQGRREKVLILANYLKARGFTVEMIRELKINGWKSVIHELDQERASQKLVHLPSPTTVLCILNYLTVEPGRPGHCLYCGIRTAALDWEGENLRPTICSQCRYNGQRDERREIEAGVQSGRPWLRPLRVGRNCTPMPDAEAAAAQAAWDQKQKEISEFNMAHSGGTS